MSDHAINLPDEDTLVIPKGWGRDIHPRRGGVPGQEPKPDKDAEKIVAPLLGRTRENLERILRAADTAPELVAAARAHLGGDPDPRGAAVIALVGTGWYGYLAHGRQFVDAWTAEYGVVFAACALTEMCGLNTRMVQASASHWRCAWVRPVEPGTADHSLDEAGALRARTLLAAASDEEYAEAVERLAERRTLPAQRFLTAYLLPTRQDWVTELCAGGDELLGDWLPREMLLSSIGSPEQLGLLDDWTGLTVVDCYQAATLRALAEGLGVAAAPLMAAVLGRWLDDAKRRKNLLEVLGVLPSDEAFRALLEHRGNKDVSAALMKAMKRFPVRALRQLAAAGATDLLEQHVRANRELVAAALPALPGGVRETVERIVTDAAEVAEAAPGDLPTVLADPPWTRVRAKPKRVVVTGLSAPEPHMAWADGESDTWLAGARFGIPNDWYEDGGDDPPGLTHTYGRHAGGRSWEERVKAFRLGRLDGNDQVALLQIAPVGQVRHLLAHWNLPTDAYNQGEPEWWMPPLAVRFGLDALPVVLTAARKRPGPCGHIVLPYVAEPVAALVADWLLRVKSGRPHAEEWLRRHGEDAVRPLLPTALGKPGKRRDAAEYALHFLARELGREAVVRVAREQRAEAGEAVEAVLAADPYDLVPRKIPEVGAFADPAVLPPVRLRNGDRVLPAAAVSNLLTILAMSTPEEPDPGLAEVREACDEASLAAFAWALFEQWSEFGERPADAWALTAVGWLGDDEAARRLAPVIRAWPGENGHHKAVKGLDTLALIGSETALMLLDGIGQKAPFKAIKKRAQEKIQEVAARLGLTGEQLGDRLIPGVNLDAKGSMTLDYGPRSFTVGFDEQLRPYVTDQNGKRRAALPKPAASDDPTLAPAAHAAFTQLKKDVRATVPNQVRRLELAMMTGRRWALGEFRELLVGHPLMWHIVRRLVWTCDGTAFRLAEDRTFADAEDELLTPGDGAKIAIAHPVTMGASVKTWSEVFADYAIAQPFPQLDRPVHRLTEQEREAVRLTRFEKLGAPWGKVVGLERRGWQRGVPLDNGTERWISRPTPGGLHVVIGLYPGINVGWVEGNEDQRFENVWLADEPDDFPAWDAASQHRFAELDEVTASEVLMDLEAVTAT